MHQLRSSTNKRKNQNSEQKKKDFVLLKKVRNLILDENLFLSWGHWSSMQFCFEALESTKISPYEPVSSQKYENGNRTKIYNFTVQWIPSVLRKTLNSCWPKTYGKKDMEKIWKIMGWSALLPKIKKRAKTLRDPTIITFPHFWGTLGVFRRQMCPVTSGRVDNCVRVGQRPYACLTISGSGVRCAVNARHYRGLHIRFPWWKRSRWVVSSHFRLISARKIMIPWPSSFFLTNW